MKRIFSLVSTVVLALSLFVVAAFAAIAEKTLRVNGMTCGGCSASVEQALKKVDGVADVKPSGAQKERSGSNMMTTRLI